MHLFVRHITRHFLTMNSNLLFASIWFCASGAFAQPAQISGPAAESQTARAQRRADLRTALQPNREPDVRPTRVHDARPVGRHLSAPERAEMRQQLRQRQLEVPHPLP